MDKIKQNEVSSVTTLITINKKVQNLEEGQFEAVLSTSDLDRHGEHVSISGLTVPKEQTLKMYYNHQTYGDAMPIGKWLRIWKQNGKLMGIGEIDLEDPFAVKIYKKILKGYIDSISIGFRALEFDGDNSTWTKTTLVEASVVAEPANVAAKVTQKELSDFNNSLKESLKAKGIDESEIDGTFTNNDDQSADQSTDEIKAAVKDLTDRVEEVEKAHKESTDNPSDVKQVIKLRLAAKKADKSAEKLNTVIRIKLAEK